MQWIEGEVGLGIGVAEAICLRNQDVWVDRNQIIHLISGMEIEHLRAVVLFLKNGNYAYGQGHKLPSLEAELARRALMALPEVIDYFKEHLK